MRQIQRQINCYLAKVLQMNLEWLGAPKSYTYGQFKDKILKPAVEEINLKIDDMDLEIFQGRYNRKVVQVEVHNNWTVEQFE